MPRNTGKTFKRAFRLTVVVLVLVAAFDPVGTALAARHHLYVGVQGDVRIFNASDQGNVSPERVLLFPQYFLSNQIAVDASGEIIACGGYPLSVPSVLVYAPHASGMATPIRDISGPNTTLVFPQGIAVDDAGSIYIDDKKQRSIDVFAPGADGNVAPVRVIAGPHTLLNKDNGALAVDQSGHIFIEQGGIFLDSPEQQRFHKDRLLEFAVGATGDVAPIAAYIPQRGSLENIAVNGQDLLVSVNLNGILNGELRIFSLPALRMIQTVRIPKWRRRLVLGADAISGGPLFALTGARFDDGIWRFARRGPGPQKFAPSPDGFLGGRQTGFNEFATDVRIGP